MTELRRVRGGAAVELVAVLPLLATLMFGCIDFGRYAHVMITVTNAGRAGAEFAATHPYTPATYTLWESQVRQAAVDEMAGLSGFDAAQLTVTVSAAPDNFGMTCVSVDVSYPFETAIGWPGLPKRLTLRQVAALPMTRQ